MNTPPPSMFDPRVEQVPERQDLLAEYGKLSCGN